VPVVAYRAASLWLPTVRPRCGCLPCGLAVVAYRAPRRQLPTLRPRCGLSPAVIAKVRAPLSPGHRNAKAQTLAGFTSGHSSARAAAIDGARAAAIDVPVGKGRGDGQDPGHEHSRDAKDQQLTPVGRMPVHHNRMRTNGIVLNHPQRPAHHALFHVRIPGLSGASGASGPLPGRNWLARRIQVVE
jgi:hypothetical protein